MNRKIVVIGLAAIATIIVIYYLIQTLFGVSLTPFRPLTLDEYSSSAGTSVNLTKPFGVISGVDPSYSTDLYRAPAIPPTYPSDTSLANPNREYIKSSSFAFVVNDTHKYLSDLTAYYLSIGGRILSSQINTSDRYTSGSLVVKVPVDQFDHANLKTQEGVKQVYSTNINSTDDTATIDSTSTRLSDLETKLLQKQQAIAAEKNPTTLKQLQLELEYIQRDIKAAQAQVDQAQARVDWANLSVTAADSIKYFKPYSSANPDLQEVWSTSLATLLQALTQLAAFAIKVLVYSVIWIPVVVIGYLVYRHFSTPPKSK